MRKDINEIFNNAETVGADVLKILEDSHSKLPELESLLSSVLDTLHAGEDGVGEVKNALPTLENKISEVAEKVNELNNNEDVKKSTIIDKVIYLLGNSKDKITMRRFFYE